MEERNEPPFRSRHGAARAPEPWLIDGAETRRALESLVVRLTSQRLWHEDLVQEAMIHLWQEECRCPGQSAGWYLRSCQFHLQNWLRLGRSIDSPKRRNGHILPIDGDDGPRSLVDSLPDTTAGASVSEVVLAHDLLSELLAWLDPLEKEILDCLLDGSGTRDTARRLDLSHTCVANKRRRIGVCLLELMTEARPRSNGRSAIQHTLKKTFPIAPRNYSLEGGVKCHSKETTCPTAML